MKMIKQAVAAVCIWASAASFAQAGANIVGTFVADVGKSHLSSSMRGCGKTTTKPFGHKIILSGDGTFREEIDLNGDDVPDSITGGLWTELQHGNISMIYDGNIAEGAGGSGAWASLLGSAEGSLRYQCTDGSVSLLYATVKVKKLSLKLNKQRSRAELTSVIEAYAQGEFTATGKVVLKANAKGQYQAL